MSQAGGKKGGGKGPPKDTKPDKNEDKDKDTAKAAAKDQDKDKDKEETGSVAGGGGDGETPPSKPPSAGTNVRDAAQKALALCQKGEWGPVDQVLKSIEKAVAAAGEEAIVNPLAGVADAVSIRFAFIAIKIFQGHIFQKNTILLEKVR